MSIKKTLYGANFDLEFDLDPAVGQWSLVEGDEGSARATYEGSGYILELEEKRESDYVAVVFNLRRGDGQQFTIERYTLSARSNIGDLHRIWMPHLTERHIAFLYMQRQLPMETLSPSRRYPLVDTRSCADARSPVILGLDRAGTVTFGVGLIDQRIETLMTERIATHYNMRDLDRGKMIYEFTRPTDDFVLGPLTEHQDGFFVSQGASWFQTMHDYRGVHDEVMNRPVEPSPDPCWEPVWVPWISPPGEWATGRIEDVDHDLLLKGAEIAVDLGFTNILNSRQLLLRFAASRLGLSRPMRRLRCRSNQVSGFSQHSAHPPRNGHDRLPVDRSLRGRDREQGASQCGAPHDPGYRLLLSP